MNYNTYILPNGLRIIHAPSPTGVVYCGLAVDAGTRDERDDEQGMAHFVEHLIFKGTSKRKAWHILNRMENVGGDLNAYTNKEETVIYASFLKEHFPRAVELLSDIVFHSVFPDREIARETEVILDEIQSYEDSPSELIFDDFENLIFKGHPLGRNILGDPDQLRNFGSRDALDFVGRHYLPGNTVFFVHGNVEPRSILRLAAKYLGDLPAGEAVHTRTAPLPYLPETRKVVKETHQAHVLLGGRGYPAHEEKRTGLYLLNNLLGGPGMNSRLNVSLREKRGLVYSVESSLTSYVDTGAFCIYFGTDRDDLGHCLELTHKELKKLRDTRLTPMQLATAKKQLIGQIGVASDNFESIALDMGKTYLHYRKFESPEEVFRRIEALTADKLQEIAIEMFSPGQLSTLIYC